MVDNACSMRSFRRKTGRNPRDQVVPSDCVGVIEIDMTGNRGQYHGQTAQHAGKR